MGVLTIIDVNMCPLTIMCITMRALCYNMRPDKYRVTKTQRMTHLVCCSVLQCVAVCCSVLQCAAVCCSVLQVTHPAGLFALMMLQCAVVCCSVLQCVAVCCSVLQCAAVCCIVLQCVAVCCSVLQTTHLAGLFPL